MSKLMKPSDQWTLGLDDTLFGIRLQGQYVLELHLL